MCSFPDGGIYSIMAGQIIGKISGCRHIFMSLQSWVEGCGLPFPREGLKSGVWFCYRDFTKTVTHVIFRHGFCFMEMLRISPILSKRWKTEICLRRPCLNKLMPHLILLPFQRLSSGEKKTISYSHLTVTIQIMLIRCVYKYWLNAPLQGVLRQIDFPWVVPALLLYYYLPLRSVCLLPLITSWKEFGKAHTDFCWGTASGSFNNKAVCSSASPTTGRRRKKTHH